MIKTPTAQDYERAKTWLEYLYKGYQGPENNNLSVMIHAITLASRSPVPAGYVVVPEVATEKMLNIGKKLILSMLSGHPRDVWSAMLSARPPVPSGDAWRPDIAEFKSIVETTMQDVWNDWTGDTGCFPDDFTWKGGNGILYFQPSKWASRVAEQIYRKIAASPKDIDPAGEEDDVWPEFNEDRDLMGF